MNDLRERPFALYNAFSATPLGGSVAAIVAEADGLDTDTLQRMARELGVPATAFIMRATATSLAVRFFSMRTEYPMCGHATLALGTWLVEEGIVTLEDAACTVVLATPAGESQMIIEPGDAGRPRVMLAMAPAGAEASSASRADVAALFRLDEDALGPSPVELSRAEFTHVMVPVTDVATLDALHVDFDAITRFSHAHGADTVCVFAPTSAAGGADVRLREFCPAVGTPESSGAGTTNRSLACYLHRHRLVALPTDGSARLTAEQGITLGRPSTIEVELEMKDGDIAGVRVGGLATRIVRGTHAGPRTDPPVAAVDRAATSHGTAHA